MTEQQSPPVEQSSLTPPSGLLETIRAGYRTEGAAITLGAASSTT